ncbi:hypothetical protein F52700_4590 [Fusarium sp. NRRL 52700]|nr:hypothetical protein F52700_4590 [Fusarium sp. NRRL 52700]
MVSLKTLGFAYVAANILGVDAGLCRPSIRTSLNASTTETTTSASVVSTSASGSSIATSASTDKTSVTDETSAANTKKSGTTVLSSSETLISPSSPSTSDVSTVETSSIHTISVDLSTSGNPITTSYAVTSAESTTSGASALSTETSTSVDSTTSSVPTTTDETSASSDVTSTGTTAPQESTTAANPTTTGDATTTSSEPTTTTSACVEPTNLLRRPGFEGPEDGDVWGFYWGGGDVEYDPAEARSGDYIGVLPVPDGQERRMEQRIHITPGREYTISFWYAVVNPPSVDTQCTIFATFDYYTTLKQVPLPSDSQYYQYTSTFIAQDNLDPAIEIGVSCPSVGNGYTAYVYIDDTSALDSNNECDATPVDPNAPPKSTLLVPAQPETPHCPVNLVQVPGFETDDDDQAWVFYQNNGEFVQDVSNARTGEREALFPSGTFTNAVFLEQNIDSSDLIPGELYDYHFFWKPKTLPDNGQCWMYGGYNDAIGFQLADIDFGATSSTGYTLYSARFTMPAGNLLLQIVFYCQYNDGNTVLGSVYVDDTALIKVAGCEAYPVTGALIENPSFEIQATDDSTYAWFGTNSMKIRAGSTADGPSPNSGDNFLYVQLGFTKKSTTLTKPLASSLNAGTTYTLQFNWAAGSAYVPSTCSFDIVFGSVSQTLDLDTQAAAYQYQLFQTSFTAGDSAESMSITVECTDASGYPDFVFDDFSLQ